ncbi:hypothetical protein 10S11_31 [uncultured Caudovirales phage]|uniref:Uncharacterized protein n=1 Tax=uncultured Caudovirales phage TaxID=2100421 RepID=A0A2H4J333_9CAUD|nr:hypothetical protein 10S11_31 [uncultured Caudovirales phage]
MKKRLIIEIICGILVFIVGYFVGDASAIRRVNEGITEKVDSKYSQKNYDADKVSNSEKQKINNDNKSKEENNKKITDITEGELYNKINSVEKVKCISTIEDKEIGFTNLTISVNVPQGSAIEEVESYINQTGKMQANLGEYFAKQNFLRITYAMYVNDEMKSSLIIYKKEKENYILEDTIFVEDKYKKAIEVLN